ncbi:MAG: DNA primase [Candidatus Nomurabacteria bacterium]|nr:MAG: DNA primase [Candidatus Nomurabacteria bacterium]
MQDAKEEVRSRLNIEDVIGEYVPLKRSGRNFKGLSPFSGEKTPSFYVSPDKHIWHDFSSGKGGDVFSFVMEVEGMDFRQALELLARRAGVDLSLYQSSGSQDLAKRKKRLLAANELAATYYQQSLLRNEHAQQYVFKKRGLNKKVVQDFKIGYAPDSGDALTSFLKKKGFTPQELSDAGLTNRYGGDLFRGRMMVSLMDSTGQVVGFTGRIINDDPSAPKYLNTPQTLLYDKSRHVFGFSQAKEAIRKTDYVVVVEGNLDVVSSHQVEVSEVVATAGTALTEHHLRALGRLTPHIRLAFDADKAGLAATERAIPIAQMVGVELTIISLPNDAKDPDELIQRDVALWKDAINTAQPVVDWVIARFAEREKLDTAAGKRAFTTAALNVVRALSDPVEQDHYLSQIAKMTDTTRDALIRKLASVKDEVKTQKAIKKTKQVIEEPRDEPDRKQDTLLAVALVDIQVQDLFTGIDSSIFRGKERRAVATYLAENEKKKVESIPVSLEAYEKYVTMLLLHPDVDNVDWSSENRVATATDVLRSLQANYQKTKKEQLIQQEAAARERGDDAAAGDYLRQLSILIKGEK